MVDVLYALIPAARRFERSVPSEDQLVAAVAEAEEFRDFKLAVKPGLSRGVVTAAKAVLELVPALKLLDK